VHRDGGFFGFFHAVVCKQGRRFSDCVFGYCACPMKSFLSVFLDIARAHGYRFLGPSLDIVLATPAVLVASLDIARAQG
jgi:hypothetical protein